MGINILRGFLFCSFLVASSLGLSPLDSEEPSAIKVFVERIDRISRDEVRIRLKVTNKSDRALFVAAYDFVSPPRVELASFEQWRPKKGWKWVGPCRDMPPPALIKLNPGESINSLQPLVSHLPLICKQRTIRLEGKFRIQLLYFESEEHWRTYRHNRFVLLKEEKALVAVSEPFEIPSTSNPEVHPRPKT